jgi:hypothetical protein
MKITLLAGLALACVLLSGCAGVTSLTGGSSSQLADTLKAIASDPNCGHTDRIQGNLGGLGGNNLNVYLERTCPPHSTPIAAVVATPAPAP